MLALSFLLFLLDIQIILSSFIVLKKFYDVKKENLSYLRNWNVYYLYNFLIATCMTKIVPLLLYGFSGSINIYIFQYLYTIFGGCLFFASLFLFLYLEGKTFSESKVSKAFILIILVLFSIFLIPPGKKAIFITYNTPFTCYLNVLKILSPLLMKKIWIYICILIFWTFIFICFQILKGSKFKKTYLSIMIIYFSSSAAEFIGFFCDNPITIGILFLISRILVIYSLIKIHKLFGEKDDRESYSK